MPAKAIAERRETATAEAKTSLLAESIGAIPGETVIRVGLQGLAPGLLMHNPGSIYAKRGTKPKSCSHGRLLDKPCVDCLEAATYRTTDGRLCIPSVALHGAIINGARQAKIGKRSAVPIISGVLRVRPFDIPLTIPGAPFDTTEGKLDFKIDTRWVVIQHQRVINYRPWIPEWSAEFYLLFDPSYLSSEEVLREIVTRAGRQVGVLDFRPAHTGAFGTFVITKWETITP